VGSSPTEGFKGPANQVVVLPDEAPGEPLFSTEGLGALSANCDGLFDCPHSVALLVLAPQARDPGPPTCSPLMAPNRAPSMPAVCVTCLRFRPFAPIT
jgi:hypothetical protein